MEPKRQTFFLFRLYAWYVWEYFDFRGWQCDCRIDFLQLFEDIIIYYIDRRTWTNDERKCNLFNLNGDRRLSVGTCRGINKCIVKFFRRWSYRNVQFSNFSLLYHDFIGFFFPLFETIFSKMTNFLSVVTWFSIRRTLCFPPFVWKFSCTIYALLR